MKTKVPAFLLQPNTSGPKTAKVNLSFVDKTLLSAARATKAIYLQAQSSLTRNAVFEIHPGVKLFSLLYLVVIISIKSNIHAQLLATSLIFTAYLAARLRITEIYRRIFSLAFIFGFLVVLPASLNVIVPGKIVINLISLDRPVHFWIYTIPREIGFTIEGFRVVLLIFLRVFNSVSLAMFIIYTTSFPGFIKSFKIIGVPDTFLMIITLAYKFIFILSRTLEDLYLALKSRLIGDIRDSSIRNLVSGRVFTVFKKSMWFYENTCHAMISRGYKGKVVFDLNNRLSRTDLLALVAVLASGIGIILI